MDAGRWARRVGAGCWALDAGRCAPGAGRLGAGRRVPGTKNTRNFLAMSLRAVFQAPMRKKRDGDGFGSLFGATLKPSTGFAPKGVAEKRSTGF